MLVNNESEFEQASIKKKTLCFSSGFQLQFLFFFVFFVRLKVCLAKVFNYPSKKRES